MEIVVSTNNLSRTLKVQCSLYTSKCLATQKNVGNHWVVKQNLNKHISVDHCSMLSLYNTGSFSEMRYAWAHWPWILDTNGLPSGPAKACEDYAFTAAHWTVVMRGSNSTQEELKVVKTKICSIFNLTLLNVFKNLIFNKTPKEITFCVLTSRTWVWCSTRAIGWSKLIKLFCRSDEK